MSADIAIEAPGIAEPDLGNDAKVFKRHPLTVAWATCRTCARQAVPLTEDRLCDICGPVAAATEAARFSKIRAKY